MARRYTGNTMSLFDASPSPITGNSQLLEPNHIHPNQSLFKDYSNDNPETQEHIFQPTIDRGRFDFMMRNYRNNPNMFSEEQIQDLEQHAYHYNVEFFRDPLDEQFRMGEIIKQAGAGWISGFTTLEIGEQPQNKWERIARNVGHLGGFVGFVPGAAQAAQAATRAGIAGSSILMGLAKLKGKSVPMLIAGKATEKASKLAVGMRGKALKGHGKAKDAASTFLNNKIANDMFEGAFHLGTASAVSSWTHGVDAMVSSAIHGAAFGAVFRSIGNILKSGASGDAKLGEDLIGGMAGALFQGLPSTLRGDTTPEQITEYLMGAYFGFQEGPYHVRTAQKYKAELAKEIVGKKMPADKLQEKVADDLLNRDWDAKQREAVKDVAEETIMHEQVLAMIKAQIKKDPTLMKQLEGIEIKRTDKGEVQAEADITYAKDRKTLRRIRDEAVEVERKAKKEIDKLSEKDYADDSIYEPLRQKALDANTNRKMAELEVLRFDNKEGRLTEEGKQNLKDLESWYKTKQKEIEDSRKPKELDPELTEDTGTIIEYDGISSPVKSAAEKTLSRTWKVDGVEDLYLKRDNIRKLQKHLDKMVLDKDMNVNRVARFLEKEFKVDMKDIKNFETERAFYRNYLKRRISMKPIQVGSPIVTLKYDSTISSTGKWYKHFNKIGEVTIDTLDPVNPKNRANNDKAIDAPILFVESIYAKEMANRGKTVDLDSPTDRPVERVDHIMMRAKNVNLPKEYKMSELGEIISRDLRSSFEGKRRAKHKDFKNLSDKDIQKRVDAETRAHLEEFTAELTKHYDDKGMHYLSGRGDGDLSYYIKYHPGVANRRKDGINRDYNNALKMLKDAGVPNVDAVMREEVSKYTKAFGKHLGGKEKAKEMFKKTYVSNMMWENSNNGFEASKTFRDYLNTGVTTPNLMKNTIKNFIGNSIAFNKRQQIWLTNGVPVDHKAVQMYMSKFGVSDLVVTADGRVAAKAIITVPGEKSTDKPWKQKATDMGESNDGDTTTRSDFLTGLNFDAGHPLEAGVTKNFIVSPDAKHGAILGKHMMFDAGKIQSDAMLKTEGSNGEKGFHFLLPESSAKQFGTRKAYVTKLNKKGEYEFFDAETGKKVEKPEMYEVPLEDLKTVLSEVTSDHAIIDARIPKQLATNLLTNMYYSKGAKPVTKEIIDDWYKDYHLKQFYGTKQGNAIMDAFKKEPSNQNLDKVIKNLEDINTAEVVELLTTPGYETYAAKVYDRIARINRVSNESLRQEGEANREQAEEVLRESDHFKGAVDKVLNLSKDGDLGVHLHKITDKYRQQIVRNYIVNSLTRPRMDSGMTARMMGYDLELQQRFPELQTRKDVYYLGDSMGNKNIRKIIRKEEGLLDRLRDTGISSAELKRIKNADTLKELWETIDPKLINSIKTKKTIDIVKDFFEGINVRIPMDSASGAHVLRFGGFTGRKGYTVLVHPESMRALGGADSDGDKAFIFFDMKAKYKDAYRNSRNEFVKYAPKSEYKNKNPYENALGKESYESLSDASKQEYYPFVTDNKQEFRGIFTKEADYANPDLARKAVEKYKHKARMYSPMLRQEISQNAAGGRGNLGPAVVGRQVVGAAHAALGAKEGRRALPGWEKFKEMSSKEKEQFTEDEKYTMILNNIYKGGNDIAEVEPGTYSFELGPRTNPTEYIMTAKTTPKELARARELARASIAFPSDPLDEIGLVHKDVAFAEVFKGFFKIKTLNKDKSKEAGKEIYEPVEDPAVMRKGLNRVFSDINSALFGRDVANQRAWDYFSLKDKLGSVYELAPEQRNSILAKLAETISPIDWQDNLSNRINYKAIDKLMEVQQSSLKTKDQRFFEVARELERAGFSFKLQKPIRDLLEGRLQEGSKEWIDANEFLSNELHNLVGFQRGSQYWLESIKTDGKLSRKRNKDGKWVAENSELREIGQFVRKIMDEAYRMDVDANAPFKTKVTISGIEQWYGPNEMNQLRALMNSGKGPKNVVIEKQSVKFKEDVQPMGERQEYLDNQILDFKKGLSENGKKSLDWLLISGFKVNREGDHSKWKKLKRDGGLDPAMRSHMMHQMYGTTQNRFAFQSNAVSEVAIKQFWKDYSKVFEQARVEPPEAVGKDIDNAVEFAKGRKSVINKEEAKLEVENLNKDSAEPSMTEADNFIKNYREKLNDFEAFKKISEMKDLPSMSNETLQLQRRLETALEKKANYIGGDLELFIRGMFNKTPDQMTMLDARALVNMLENPGSWYQETRAKFHKNVKTGKEDAPLLTKWIHMMFPRSVDRLWLNKEMRLVETATPLWRKNEKGEWQMDFVKGKQPKHFMGEMQWTTSELQRLSTDAQALEEKKIMGPELAKENLSWLSGIKDADRLHELSIMKLEKGIGESFYLKGKHGTADAYRYHELSDPNSKLSKELESFEKKTYTTLIDGGKNPRTTTGKEIMGRIQLFWRAKNKDYYENYIKGRKDHIDKYFTVDENGNQVARVDDFVRDAKRAIQAGKMPHEVIQIGIDNMNRMANHVMIRNTSSPEFKRHLAKRFAFMETRETKDYWHHTDFDQAELTKALKASIENIKKTPAKNKKQREQQISKAAQLAFQLRNITGNWENGAFENWGMYDALKVEINARLKKKESLQGLEAPMKTSAQNSRQLNVRGWDRTHNAGVKYGKSLLDTYYNNMTQILGREAIRSFEMEQVKKYKKDGKVIDKAGWENAKAWKNWFEMYLNESMGFPTIIPDYYLNNKFMNLKGTPYHWFADSTVKNRINKISDKLGIKGNTLLEKEIGQYMDYNKIRSWTNLEAKYQLSTLLAHPKTAIANVFGGSALTIQSAGFRHWKNARNFKFLRDNIDPTWTNKSDAGKWVESLGIVEQFLTYEAGLSPYTKDLKVKKAYEKLIDKIKKDPNVSDVTLRQIWKESGLGANIFDKAAWFMRRSERMLRRDSFLAHYLQARDVFGEAIVGEGARDHPFLINWARRGVQDTQFLYTAAFRPAFARSALGKVMTRFQLWAWNSVSFRNKVLREAKIYGFQEGTPEFERFKRTAAIDLMVFGLASAFTYSLFEANLPAPYNWIQDTADWLFGDEKQRDRAFFGSYPSAIAPLQAVTPPAARLVGPTMKAMIDDDWTKMSNYYIWTMFPFGRLARDVKNSVQNPIRTVENLTGVPYINTHRYLKKTREIGEEDESVQPSE